MSTSSQKPRPLSATAAFKNLARAIDSTLTSDHAADLLANFRAAVRTETLTAAVEAARSEYLTDNTGTDTDNAYNQGITDAIAAIGELLEGGAA